MSNRIEALRLATSISSDPEKVVGAAQKFYEFLNDAIPPSSPATTSSPETTKVTSVETEKQTTVDSTPEVDINTRVQALAKALVKKDRPKLLAALKELGFEKASLISADKLPAAEKLFTQALA